MTQPPDTPIPLPRDLPGQQNCWCGESRATVFWSGRYRRGGRPIERSTVLRCGSCGTLRSGPQEGVAGLRGDGPGGAFRNEEPNEWERLNAGIVLRQGLGGPLLEVGANTGMLLDLLREAGMEGLCGLEPNPACAEEARKRGHDVRVGWFLANQTPPGPFRMIVMSHVLEHIPELTGAVRLAASRLALGGRLLVFVPNAGSWRARADYGKWGPLSPTDHLWHFEPASLRALLERSGLFRIERLFTTRLRPLRYNSPRRLVQAVREKIAPWFGKAEQLVAVAGKSV
jgi:SAM-dependent methyltransferase